MTYRKKVYKSNGMKKDRNFWLVWFQKQFLILSSFYSIEES